MLSEIIKNYIDKKGLKYSVISENIGIPMNTFSAMLNGKRKILAEEYFKICEFLEISTDYFASLMSKTA